MRERGMGMSAEQLSRVRERFFRADSAGEIPGTGLGMSIVKEIVELPSGRLSIESVQAQGMTVVLQFPQADQLTRPAELPAA